MEVLRRYLRIVCISAQKSDPRESVEFLAGLFREVGLEARAVAATGGPPVVVAKGRGASRRSITFYNHYDVQPADPLAAWSSPPFEPAERGGRVFARGVADNKANLLARVAAVKALRDAGEPLPCDVTFFVEGEEEVGSPHLAATVAALEGELKSDLCIWESSYRDESGRFQVTLGCKGMAQGEFVVRGPASDMHSSRAVIVPSPAWRLVQLLAAIRPGDDVAIPGFAERALAPDEGEVELLKKIPFDEGAWRRAAGGGPFVKGLTGLELVKHFFFAPTFNLSGLTSGYQGPGHKTVLPSEARAKFDIRLVADMEPGEVLAGLRRFLDERGFRDVAIENVEGYPPARTPHTDPMVRLVVRSSEACWPQGVVVHPLTPASGPMYLFRRMMPCAGIGVGHAGSNIHAPDENVVIEDYHAGARHVATLLRMMGDS
jgi:acetylornithine deacetylase/succinyl-diaminopimelate desuccinylase-like protein